MRYRFDIAYDGTAYFGWQVQPNGITVQEKIESAIHEVTGATVKLHGSGRTDQGVHARRQVAHADLPGRIDERGVKKALNAVLPGDIRILALARASASFHARHSATGKEYRYFIWNADIVPPFLRNYRTHIRDRLDDAAMREAAAALEGRHDFAAFTANPNRPVESTVRDLRKLTVSKHGSEITVSAVADGFLYKMVRSLVGFLVRVGEGAEPPSEATVIIESRVRTARVPTAPPQGLFLWNVHY